MVNRLLVWAGGNSRLERIANTNSLAAKIVHRYVAGPALEDGVAAAVQLNGQGIRGVLDLLGEAVTDLTGASEATKQYLQAVETIAERGIDATVSLKLTQLGLLIDREACVTNLATVLDRGRDVGVGVEIDMEQSDVVGETIEVYRDAAAAHPDTRLAMQACLRRTPEDLDSLAALQPRIRLVKGAYAEPIDRALRSRKEITAEYQHLSEWLLKHGKLPAFGTHDDACIDFAIKAANRLGLGQRDFEIQLLYGIRRDLQHDLADRGYRVGVYIPFGSAWYPYLMRRMAERPANLLFFLRAAVGR
jgi:proline dehydrogenase